MMWTFWRKSGRWCNTPGGAGNGRAGEEWRGVEDASPYKRKFKLLPPGGAGNGRAEPS